MKTIVLATLAIVLLFTSPSLTAQSPTPDNPLASCGDSNVSFNVSRGPVGTQSKPAPGKALVYIVQVSDLHDRGKIGRPLIRLAMDGRWVGATQGFTYLSASVDPGTHHLCSRWQSSLARFSDQVSLNNFEAVAGKIYYFRLQIGYEAGTDGGQPAMIDLQPVSDDEGLLLVSKAAQSMSTPKN